MTKSLQSFKPDKSAVTTLKYSDITSQMIGAAMEVHRILKNGFQEVIYQRALEKEMRLKGLNVHREFEMPIIIKKNKSALAVLISLWKALFQLNLKLYMFWKART